MKWMHKPFIEYLNAVDDLLETTYGITSDDSGMALIASCHEAGDTPKECVQQIAEKDQLETIGKFVENLLYA